MSLADYLAKNYLNADTVSSDRPKKKRKKNRHGESKASEGDGLIIADDDDLLFLDNTTKSKASRYSAGLIDGSDEADEFSIAGINSGTGEFRKSRASNWQTVAEPSNKDKDDGIAADAILASAAAEREAEMHLDDEGPTIANEDDAGVPRMESGMKAGLQTAADTAAMVAEQERRQQKDEESLKRERKRKGKDERNRESETIYRDASGRIINVAMKRAEARKAAAEAAETEKAAKEALTGDVQRKEKELRRIALEEAKFIPLARTVDDEELNREMKAAQRWNDPAAEFLTSASKHTSGAAGHTAGNIRKKTYQGAAPPNRYKIRPGHRWDGVDRGNGFEQKWFDARTQRGRMEQLEYAWQMDE
ncbi:Pre-mRNA-splicing factor cwc26 [Myotisia sp. PD_48]|nr:Pre-mRNA-splicing factor cwc26 [Myotisia sp. PD_48]